MKNFITVPREVREAISHNHLDQENPNGYSTRVFMVVDVKTGRPQHFFQTHEIEDEAECGFGCFFDYDVDPTFLAPVDIMDRETALYLIGQDAVSRAINKDRQDSEQDSEQEAPVFRLVPVFSAMVPNCIISNPAK